MNTVKINKKKTLIVAHRGLSGIEAENTCASFIAAGNRSYYGIETDIRRTADGRFVVNHDGDLKRIGGEEITVEDNTLEYLQSVVLLDKDGSKDRTDLRPCTLENYISICKKYEKQCVLELKSDFTIEETEKYIEIIRSLDYLDRVTFISFKYDVLLKIKTVYPQCDAQYLSSTVDDDYIQKITEGGFDVDVKHKCLTKELVKRFHKMGKKVNCWTVDSKEDAEKYVKWGVDLITSNILE